MALFDGSESGGGEDPATDLVDALEIHGAESFVALPCLEVVDGAAGIGREFREFPSEEGRALPCPMLPDARGAVVGLAHIDAAGRILEHIDARGGALLLGWGGIGIAQPAPGQPSAVRTRLGVAGADKVACAAAAEAEALGVF